MKEIFKKTTIVRLDVLFGQNDGLFSIWKNYKTIAHDPFAKGKQSYFLPTFCQRCISCKTKLLKTKIFMENYLNYLAQNHTHGKN